MDRWKKDMWEFVTNILGVDKSKLRWRQHSDKERSHYSKDTYDLDFEFPFGWKELWGIAYRTDYDLKQHMKHSGVSLEYVDSVLGKKFIPHVIEPAVGINRIFLMVLANAYREEGGRVYLALKPSLAPCTVAVFPLVANREDVVSKAKGIYHELKKAGIKTNWDARGNIGKRYFAQDEVGTPWCVTIDYQSLEDETVTVRERDTAKQERIKVSNLSAYFQERLKE